MTRMWQKQTNKWKHKNKQKKGHLPDYYKKTVASTLGSFFLSLWKYCEVLKALSGAKLREVYDQHSVWNWDSESKNPGGNDFSQHSHEILGVDLPI